MALSLPVSATGGDAMGNDSRAEREQGDGGLAAELKEEGVSAV